MIFIHQDYDTLDTPVSVIQSPVLVEASATGVEMQHPTYLDAEATIDETQHPPMYSSPDSPLIFEDHFLSSSSNEDSSSPGVSGYSSVSSSPRATSSSASDKIPPSHVNVVTDATYPTMKLVGDNIDKYVKPREMRADSQASTLHFFNMYAVRDQVDTSSLEDEPSLPDLCSIDLDKLFLSIEDKTTFG